ncbi:MAG: hypothetical protein KBC91_04135 [Candidatus Omnitrophica bacterium]|nr:hypothetical protein [Candidatus Omnitrophota bacterium]
MTSLPLEFFWAAQNASWLDEHGWKLPAAFNTGGSEALALTQSAALTDQSHRGKVKVTGSESVSFLNRMLTNDLNAVSAGQGQRTFLLSAQGKCLADFRAFRAPDFILLDTEPGLAPDAIKLLDRFIITDDVRLEDITFSTLHLSLEGPQAENFRTALQIKFPHAALFSLPQNASLSGYPALHLWLPADQTRDAAEILPSLKIPYAAHTAFNTIRLERKVPRFKIDFDETWFLNETGLEDTAASETKGCYPGQEVVARIKTYKKVEQRLFK